jgi:hypothetical protein
MQSVIVAAASGTMAAAMLNHELLAEDFELPLAEKVTER